LTAMVARRAGRAVTAAALGLVVGMGTARADIVTHFVEPDRYTDARDRFGSGLSLRVVLGEIRRIIEGEGRRVLRPGETLTIDVVDVDLAGYERPGANVPSGIRVVSDISPPRIRIRYVLTIGGRRVLAGDEILTDQNFLIRSAGRSAGTFAYERDLIRTWMRDRIAERRPTRS